MWIGLVDAVLLPKILGRRQTQILVIPDFDYYFRKVYSNQKKARALVLLRIILVLPHTSNRIYLLQNCFSNYVYLKDMYITSKRIGNIQFTSMLRILLICTFLSFAATFTKKNFSKFGCNFPLGKANFSLIHSTHIATYSF